MKKDLLDKLVRERRPRFWTPNRLLLGTVAGALLLTAVTSQFFLADESFSSGALVSQPMFLLKIAFVLGIVFSALSIVRDLACPGRRTDPHFLLVFAPFLIIAALSANEFLRGHSQDYSHQALHATVTTCLWQIGLLALPSFAALVVAARSLAPVNLAKTGFYIGLLSGAIGAFGYAFHCHENFVSIVALSYSLALIPMAILGSWLGPTLLRWS